MHQSLLILLALCAQPDGLPRDGQRIVFLGDSITAAGGFIRDIEAYLVTRFPQRHVQIINLGLGSETVTGLTETDHPFPRPDVHDRLARALALTKPDHVVACYGMNDGIYHPFDEARFAAYQKGIHRLIAAVQAAGAKLTLLTPGPFEASAIPDRLRPAGAADYSYKAPYADYDDTLAHYGKWLMTLRSETLEIIDIRTFILAHAESMRNVDPKFHLTGDAIHPGPAGQWLIASALLEAWHAPAEVDTLTIELDGDSGAKASRGQVGEYEENRDKLPSHFTWTTSIPAPLDPSLGVEFVAHERIREQFNMQRLVVHHLPGGRYLLRADEILLGRLVTFELNEGIDLLAYPTLPTNARAAEIRALLDRRERLLTDAWVAQVGHKRPQNSAGRPLPEAQAEAAILEAKARKLAEPVTLNFRMQRIGN
jgi:lysophospholipase L1-like esterase